MLAVPVVLPLVINFMSRIFSIEIAIIQLGMKNRANSSFWAPAGGCIIYECYRNVTSEYAMVAAAS